MHLRFLAVGVLAVAGSCGDDGPTPPGDRVVRVELVAGDTIGLVGAVLALTARAFDAAGAPVADPAFEWSTSDTLRARVDADGRVTLGPLAGRAVITAQSGTATDSLALRGVFEGTVKWSVTFGDSFPVIGGPALGADGTVYVLTRPRPNLREEAYLRALSPRGGLLWSTGPLDRTGANGHLVGPDGTIYVTGRTVRAFDPAGTLRWEHPLLGASAAVFIFGALTDQGTLIVAGEDSPLSLDLVTGDTVWAGPVSAFGGWLVPPTVAGPRAYLKLEEDSVFQVDLPAGALIAFVPDPDTALDKRSFGVGPVVAGDRVYVPLAYRLAAFDTTGAQVFLTPQRGRGVSEPVITRDGRLIVQEQAGMRGLAPDGSQLWLAPGRRARWSWHGGPALATGDVLYLATIDGFYAYNVAPNNVSLRWGFQVQDGTGANMPFTGAPVIAPDGTVYSYTDTHLYAFWANRPPEPESPWPMWRHDAQRTGFVPR